VSPAARAGHSLKSPPHRGVPAHERVRQRLTLAVRNRIMTMIYLARLSLLLCTLSPAAAAAAASSDSEAELTPPLPPWARDFQPGAALQQLVDTAIAAGTPSVTLPAGSFYFGGDALTIRGAVSLHVHGAGPSDGGTSLWFSNTASGMVEVLSCVNTTVEGLSMDTITPTYSQGKLIALDTSGPIATATVAIDAGFPGAKNASF
jgi:hypothetical protein